MNDFVSFFLLLIVATIFYVYLETKSLDVVYVKSETDNRDYLVRNRPDKQEAANLLGNIHLNMSKLIEGVNQSDRQENYTSQNIEDII